MQYHIQMLILVFAAVFLTYVITGVATSSSLVYACWPNDTLKIQNPGGYQGVFANNSNTICTITSSHNKLFFYVTDCPQNISISVTFSNYSGINSGILGGKQEVEAYLITCLQLPANGIFRNVSASIDPKFLSSNQSTIYPDYNVTSDIYMVDFFTGSLYYVFDATIGQQLIWIIDIMEDHLIMRPELCTAYPGRDLSTVTNETSRKVITQLGCSTDNEVTSDFIWNNPYTFLRASLYAFRFFESEYVTIECDVRICPEHSIACNMDCSDRRRKREDPAVVFGMTRAVAEIRIQFSSCTKGYSCTWMIAVLVVLVDFMMK